MGEKKLLKTLFEEKLKGQKATKLKNSPPSKGSKKADTGFVRVNLVHCYSCKSGEMYRYVYFKNGRKRSFSSVNLLSLKEKVEKNGFEWGIVDVDLARGVAEKERVSLEDLI